MALAEVRAPLALQSRDLSSTPSDQTGEEWTGEDGGWTGRGLLHFERSLRKQNSHESWPSSQFSDTVVSYIVLTSRISSGSFLSVPLTIANMSSLRTRRASQFPPQQTTSAFQRNLDAVPEIPEIPVHHISSSSLNPSSIPSAGYPAQRPGGGTKRTPSYVRRADVVREAEGRDKRRMSRVGEKIRKRLSLR